MSESIQDFKDMKAMWIELNNRLSSLEATNKKLAQEVRNNRYKTSVENLINRYRRFLILELLMGIFFPLMLINNPLVVEKFRYITAVYWTCFFIIELVIDYILMTRLQNIDIYNSTVSHIARITAQNWKFHKLAIIFGLPLAIGAIILFALAMDANIFIIYGMIVGFIVGAVIGIRQLLNFKRDYKNLQISEI